MKKVIGFLLVFCLLLQLPSNGFLSYAAETGSGNTTAEEGDDSKNSAGGNVSGGDVTSGDVTSGDVSGGNAVMGSKSRFDVEIKSLFNFSNGTEFTVTLKGPETDEERTLQLEQKNGYTEGKVSFDDLEEGNYDLEVTSDQYTTYQQKILMKNGFDYAIELYTDRKDIKFYEDEKQTPGTILIGNLVKKADRDEDPDTAVSQTDVDYLVDALFAARKPELEKLAGVRAIGDEEGFAETGNGAEGSEEAVNILADVNRDEVVDVQDLQYLAENFGVQNTTAFVTTSISTKAVAVEEAANTKIETKDGKNVNEVLFSDDSSTLGLTPTEGEHISEDNPVEIGLTLAEEKSTKGVPMEGLVVKSPVGDNGLKKGEIDVTYYDPDQGKDMTIIAEFGGTETGRAKSLRVYTMVATVGLTVGGFAREDAVERVPASMDENGNIVVNLGRKVAVKKVTIKVTATTSANATLAEISKVEFLNNMEDRIPEPVMNKPVELNVTDGSKTFTVTWKAQTNITGYEVEVEHFERGSSTSKTTQVIFTDVNSITFTALNGEEIVNLDTYKVRVRSVNAEWKGPYSDTVIAAPKPDKAPAAPDNVVATGGQNRITISWKKMKDTEYYTVHYQKKDALEEETPIEVHDNQYVIMGLGDLETYTVWVVGYNTNPDTGEIRQGPASFKSTVTTTKVGPVIFPQYNVINKPFAEGEAGKNKLMTHIKDAFYNIKDRSDIKGMKGDSQLDKVIGKAHGVVDNDYATYYYLGDWDDGRSYPSSDKGFTVQLTEKHKMNVIMFADVVDNISYKNVAVYYLDENGYEALATLRNLTTLSDVNGRRYYMIKLDQPIETDQVRICLEQWSRYIGVAEIRFYEYDDLEDRVMALFKDNYHLVLREDVDQKMIDGLRKELNTKKDGELHPEYDLIELELQSAEAALRDKGAFSDEEFIEVNPNINSSKDSKLGFGGLNAWQPLGITAYTGEKLIVYVGNKSLANENKPGANARLKLVATQYHAESSPFMAEISTQLKIGRNEITIPEIASFDFERGGSLYIEYTGSNTNDQYAVRVLGGQRIPVLNLYKVDQEKWKPLVADYLVKLTAYVANQEALHNKIHKGSGVQAIDMDYDNQNCILGATEIMLDQMMYSVSGEQILKGLSGASTIEAKADMLVESLKAMEEMMTLFYHHKGLSNDKDVADINRIPMRHLNIRYHRMFAGAFMYASGNHIGIEWDSVPGLAQGVPIGTDAKGRYESGRYFGWGIAHEIGHDINQSTYAIAEVTNNYFSVLAQADDKNLSSVRFDYEKVYDKVTSGALGRDANVFTQLGMYWQLHLAYDDGYNYKIYDNYKDQLDNLFFARVDTYARTPASAPKSWPDIEIEEGKEDPRKALTLTGDTDQKLMRLAIAAAKKDLTEFFQRWGMVPDEETLAYAAQFPKEERAIYYVNDLARAYRVENAAFEAEKTIKDKAVMNTSLVKASTDPVIQNQVTLTLNTTNCDPEAILGYEITRCITSKGQEKKEVVGFIMQSVNESGKPVTTEYVDTISSINNRVFTYEVVAVDKFLNRSQALRLDPIKVSHDGSLDKTYWTVTTNMASVDDHAGTADIEWDPCEPEIESAVTRVLDNDGATVYTGSCIEADPQIVIALNKMSTVEALKYNAPADENRISDYVIEIKVSEDEEAEWIKVAEGTFPSEGVQVVYFGNGEDDWVCTYDVAYVRLTATGQSGKHISVGELDLLGPSGDNVEFRNAGDSKAFGYLTADYVFDASLGANGTIPAGSLVFVGQYKGNPAYNVVVLYDENGKIVGGTNSDGSLVAEQIVLAEVPDNGLPLGETSDGTFLYWIKPADKGSIPGKVRAELYRVDNALTNEGERLVSDTYFVTIDRDNIPELTLGGSGE